MTDPFLKIKLQICVFSSNALLFGEWNGICWQKENYRIIPIFNSPLTISDNQMQMLTLSVLCKVLDDVLASVFKLWTARSHFNTIIKSNTTRQLFAWWWVCVVMGGGGLQGYSCLISQTVHVGSLGISCDHQSDLETKKKSWTKWHTESLISCCGAVWIVVEGLSSFWCVWVMTLPYPLALWVRLQPHCQLPAQ